MTRVAYSLFMALALTGFLPDVSLSPPCRRAWGVSWRSPSAASFPILALFIHHQFFHGCIVVDNGLQLRPVDLWGHVPVRPLGIGCCFFSTSPRSFFALRTSAVVRSFFALRTSAVVRFHCVHLQARVEVSKRSWSICGMAMAVCVGLATIVPGGVPRGGQSKTSPRAGGSGPRTAKGEKCRYSGPLVSKL